MTNTMNRLFLYFTLFVCTACCLANVSCIDESLRRGSDENSRPDIEKPEDDPDIIREVSDPQAALATANCIMAVPGSRISIPIAKAFAVWEEYKRLLGKTSTRGDMVPILLWAYPEDLIATDELDISDYEDVNKATINVRVAKDRMGSALIALMVDGTIRWSWHIWATDYAPGKELQPGALAIGPNDVPAGVVYRYANDAGDNIFMDRDLGSFPREYAQYGYSGMCYQWGRKDPFPGFAPLNFTPIKDGTVPEPQTPATYDETNMAYAIEHPDEMIAHGNRNDWYSYIDGIYNDDLWGSVSRKKTVWDPCPEGWRMPLYGLPRVEVQWMPRTYVDAKKSPIRILEPEYQFVDGKSPVLGNWDNLIYLINDTGEPGGGWTPPFYWSGSDTPASPSLGGDADASLLYPRDQSVHFPRGNALHIRCVRDTPGETNYSPYP